MTDKITFNVNGERHEIKIDSWQRSSVSPEVKLTVEEHDPSCAVVRSGDLRSWCDCGQEQGDKSLAERLGEVSRVLREAARAKNPDYARIEELNQQLKMVLQREADTQRRHDEKVERLEAEIERLREVLREVTPPPHFGESEQNKAWWAKWAAQPWENSND